MIFVDTGPLVALHFERDQYHDAARRGFETLPRPWMISNHVGDETATLLGRLAGYGLAADRMHDLYSSPSFDIVSSSRADELEAIRWMRKLADQQVSFTDCISFALMRRLGVRVAFSFDHHFRAAGFELADA